ncbi:MAG: NrtA/SsuA/CpmA family ABC transporter substrate-binding protein [Deltaproteobacteria bacterium]|nr:NrtA/SsuA/CpmA family ABC transporter substrate-binding protein [Deltaproteobacteria bacterium]
MKNKIFTIVVLWLLGSMIGPLPFPAHGQTKAGSIEKVRFADGNFIVSAAVYVAREKGFFKQEGLEVSWLHFLSGKEALETVVNGKADLATVADTPIALQVMKGARIYVLATLSGLVNLYGIAARKDLGVSSLADLQGKKIGVTLGTNAQFILDSFLLYYQVPVDKIRLIDLRPEEMAEALGSGQVQAVTSWEPFLSDIKIRLGEKALFFYDDRVLIYRLTWNLAAGQDFVRKNPETVKKVLRALLKAEDFIRENRAEARRITARYLGSDKGEFNKLWNTYRSEISLNPLLIENLESQTRWAIRNNPAAKKEVPNFLRYIYFEGLEALKPEAVTIVH